jgi:hypothetical protein
LLAAYRHAVGLYTTSGSEIKTDKIKGKRVAAMFVLFHQRICGPLAHSLFHHRPQETAKPPARIEAAYHRADAAIQKLVDLVAV